MRKNQKHKGHALERAVKFIQELILKTDPKLNGTEFSVESNKILVASGVRHEIDLLVKTLPGSMYESTWVFECKNWNKPVGKNEVIILADKVNAIRANRGFLVAKKISKHAEAQLKRDERLKFIRCTEDFLGPLSVELIHSVHELFPAQVSFKERGVWTERLRQLNEADITCQWNGQPIGFRAYIENQAGEEIAQDHRENSVRYECEGTHWRERAVEIRYEPGEFILNNIDLESMTIFFRFIVTVRRQRLRSKFELEGQGRMFSFELIDNVISGKPLEVVLVQRF